MRIRSDHDAVENTITLLSMAGCPETRRGQDSPEFIAKTRAGDTTPDIIAGPLFGFGDPRDFYIDVQEPSCAYLVRPGGNPEETAAARRMYDDALRTGVVDFSALDTAYIPRYVMGQFEAKVRKYANARQSPLYGHVFYFDVSGDAPLHRKVGSLDFLGAFCAMVMHDCGEKSAPAMFDGAERLSAQCREINWPDTYFAFLALIIIRSEEDFSFILLRNAHIRGEDWFKDNPVVKWLCGRPLVRSADV